MVAKTIALPNIHKIFLPDPGHVILEVDLAQADARVVAWDADVPNLKAIFNDPTKDLHDENAKAIYERVDKYTRPLAKRGVHAVNYVITARSLSVSLGISIPEANHFIESWFKANPQIPEWHNRIQDELETTRTIRNAFGFRKVFYERIEHVLPQAVAWIPQSTVAIAINKALLNIHRNLKYVQILSQIHDSLILQIPKHRFPNCLPELKKHFMIEIPYDDPLILPPTIEASTISWGHVQPCTWEGEFEGSKDMTPLAMKIAAGF